ncbi:hypothetical protein [Nonomuraea sp. NPDC049400]|uniref:hypothetical protein n=1 Tax=Nonomuraea sp. NPDC049400 TaxID=3364352 RepID=UPI0037955405
MVGSPRGRRDHWLVGSSATDSLSDTSRLLRLLRVQESQVRVFANQTAAWKAATQVMRTPDDGIPRSRFRPPIHVSIWS